jgi:glutamate racemase
VAFAAMPALTQFALPHSLHHQGLTTARHDDGSPFVALFSSARFMPPAIDLLAGIGYAAPMQAAKNPATAPTILVFDSGLGGITVFTEAVKARPDARFIYAADDAAFPYGALSEDDLVARVVLVIGKLIDTYHPDIVIVACNTASTLVLPALRARFIIPFIGTVPAIKPAAAMTRSGLFSVLATPGTVARDYTQGLIKTYASACQVTLVGSVRLAGFAEAFLRGEDVSDAELLGELAPCFVKFGKLQTDVVTLSCTHYPLLQPRLAAIAPWPVHWIDPAPAIARRMTGLIGTAHIGDKHHIEQSLALFTSGKNPGSALSAALAVRGLDKIGDFAMPFRTVQQNLQ